MRVVSGSCKGRPLKAVPGNQTRPTTDKVKESIFNIIGPYFDGGRVLDLFAGSGGLGIEALSRGMEQGIFVDRDHKAISTIRSNLEACSFQEQAEVYKNESERALKAIIKRELSFDLILLDPPYKKHILENLVSMIEENNLLSEKGIIVCEHASDVILDREFENLILWRQEKYGMIAVTIYKHS
ncbi:16S rRNA (guanine(966)-N(2))-methyltransferase RsmD [Peribacillus deserti]|uniref:16S rRNA (Guanine(966)-N(2))-methyltransferase RsmD n=1 Tax=Peribacillus deserti TaxID=673318 RepID=A0A2N5M000_9BACI|nr:16S rRNA (guanine(966)-N(2))-methyltransferase RsmD [Peribacillus deserti]PLT27696.1 16S rRNA (guanine(966)-N(2))-methyltransferase RsmD [Peribacillus deserti]